MSTEVYRAGLALLLIEFVYLFNPADLTIMDALNLGDKMQSILLYHFLPQARNVSMLGAARSLGTDLGVSTGSPYNLSFTQAPGGQVLAAEPILVSPQVMPGFLPLEDMRMYGCVHGSAYKREVHMFAYNTYFACVRAKKNVSIEGRPSQC